jgi:hypothetical protein
LRYHLIEPWLLSRKDVPPAAKLVWCEIQSARMLSGNDSPAHGQLARSLGLSEAVIRSSIARLQRVECRCGFAILRVLPREGASNRYETHSGSRCALHRVDPEDATPRPRLADVVSLAAARRAREGGEA